MQAPVMDRLKGGHYAMRVPVTDRLKGGHYAMQTHHAVIRKTSSGASREPLSSGWQAGD